LTFFDSAGNFRGMAADLLELIRLRTGLRFDIQRSRSDSDMIERINRTPGRPDRRPATQRANGKPAQLQPPLSGKLLRAADAQELPMARSIWTSCKGKQLAIAQGKPVGRVPARRVSAIHLIETQIPSAPSRCSPKVCRRCGHLIGHCQLFHFLAPLRAHALQITTTIGTGQAAFSLATGRGPKN
jgi:two-component system sensor histidine kinase EvgS